MPKRVFIGLIECLEQAEVFTIQVFVAFSLHCNIIYELPSFTIFVSARARLKVFYFHSLHSSHFNFYFLRGWRCLVIFKQLNNFPIQLGVVKNF